MRAQQEQEQENGHVEPRRADTGRWLCACIMDEHTDACMSMEGT